MKRGFSSLILVVAIALAFAPREAASLEPTWNTYTTADGLASNIVFALAPAPGGQLWAGTSGGLSHFNGRRWSAIDTAGPLGEPWVTALVLDQQDRVWCGTYGGGLGLWNGARWTVYTRTNAGLASDYIAAIALDPWHRLWVSTVDGWVGVFDGRRWIPHSREGTCLPTCRAGTLIIAENGTVWIGTAGWGVCALDMRGCRCYTSKNSGLGNDWITALAISEDRLWIGTEDGLYAFDIKDNVWWRWALPQRVHALTVDDRGRLWVASGGAVSVREGNRWRRYTQADGLPGNIVSAIAVGTDGALWVGTLGGGVSRYGLESPAGARPRRPVILVHGWRGPDSDRVEDSEFKFLRRWLERDGYQTFYATGISPGNTLYQNAVRLRENIARVKKLTGAAEVDIIAFSMGGLNTRAYIESALYAGDVHQAIILGTPQAGVHMWKTFLLHEIAHWSDEPSARELLPEHMALFNAVHGNDWQVPYLLVAGVADAERLPPLFRFLPPGDGLISAWSAHALRGPAVRYLATSDLHAWSAETMLLDIPSFLWPEDTYSAYLRAALRDEEALPGTLVPPGWKPLPAEVHSPVFSGQVGAGQAVTHTLELDAPGTHRFYARWQESDLVFNLCDPTGRVIDEEAAEEDDQLSYFALPWANFASYVVTTTLTGTWACRLEASQKLAKPIGYALYAVLESPLTMTLRTEQEWYRPGQSVVITVAIKEANKPVTGAQVVAEIYPSTSVSVSVALHDDGRHNDGAAGDGIYGASWQATGPGGYYPLFVSARGTYKGRRFARGAEGVIVVSSESASLDGTLSERTRDDDGDGLYEALELTAGIRVTRAGPFLLAAKLLNGKGEVIASVAMPTVLAAGHQEVSFSFRGKAIRRSFADGPYQIEGPWLIDISGAAVLLDQGPGLETRAYRWRDFAP